MPKEKPWKFQAYEGNVEDIEFKLTPQSLELFEQGLPLQGYIGLVELETGKIHLVPSFNYPTELREINKIKDKNGNFQDNKEAYKAWTNDIAEMQNKNGEFFHAVSDKGTVRQNYYVTTFDDLGSNTGKAHGKAVSYTNTGQMAGVAGMVIGFGLWKGINGVIRQFRDRSRSQNRHAIQFSDEFFKNYKRKLLELPDDSPFNILELQRERSLPQELSDALLGYLLDHLPCDPGVERKLERDGRAFDIPNPFIEAAMDGNRQEVLAFLNAGMNVNEIGTQLEHTALHAIAKLESTNPDKIPLLVDLLSHPEIRLDIKNAKGDIFTDYLTPPECKSVINNLLKDDPKKSCEIALYLLKKSNGDLFSILDKKLLYRIYLNLKNTYADEPNTIFLTKVMNAKSTDEVNQILTTYHYDYQKQKISLHDVALMDPNDKTKMPKLIELLSKPYILTTNDNKLFYKNLTNQEFNSTFSNMLNIGKGEQAVKFALWLSQKEDFNLTAELNVELLSQLYIAARDSGLDKSHQLLFMIAQGTKNFEKNNPLYNDLMFAKCCIDKEYAKAHLDKSVDINDISVSLLHTGLKQSLSNYNMISCQAILSEISFDDKKSWIKLLDSIPDKRSLRRNKQANVFYEAFRESLLAEAKKIENELGVIKKDLQEDINSETANDYSEELDDLQSAVSLFLHPYFQAKNDSQSSFPNLTKLYAKVNELNEKLIQKLQDKPKLKESTYQKKGQP